MIKQQLGQTDIQVSRLCFGALTLGPLQANLSPNEAGDLIKYAHDLGVNFIDTADLYRNYDHIKKALEVISRKDLVIASKSYAYDTKTAEETFFKALRELGTDYMDIWLMHEQESLHTMRGHEEALAFYVKMKEKGYLRAIGLSTHYVQGVEAGCAYPEIEVIHPIYNLQGIGIQGGTKEDMLLAIKKAHQLGKGIYGMKILGGGNLLKQKEAAFDDALSNPYFHSMAIGMQSKDEITYNVKRIKGDVIPDDLAEKLSHKTKKLLIEPWCTLCMACQEACQHGALCLDEDHKQMQVNTDKCVLCGYCAPRCPEFCIKVI